MTARHPLVAAAARAHQLLDERLGDEVSVDFGPKPGRTESLDAIVIGLSTEDVGVLSGVVEQAGLARQTEVGQIGCMAQAVSGDGDPLAVLDRAYQLMDEVAAVLRDDEDAGQAGIWWQGVSRHQSHWVPTEAGPGAQVSFYVAVNADRRLIE